MFWKYKVSIKFQRNPKTIKIYISSSNFAILKFFFDSNFYPNLEDYSNLNWKYKKCIDYRYLTIPFFGPKSTKLKKEILELVNKYCPDLKLKIILNNNFKICNFFPYKDRLPVVNQSSLIYKFSCASCDASYVGMTSRSLSARIAEHNGVSLRTGVPLLAPPHSSIRDHTEKCPCDINVENFKIIKKSNSDFSLKILESLFIFTSKPKLNAMNASYPLSTVVK